MAAYAWDEFVERCLAARREPESLAAVAEVVAATVADPRRLEGTVTIPLPPDDEGIIHRSDELLIVNVVFPRGFRTGIHDHRMPAVIGAWAGHEDNLLYQRSPGPLEAVGVRRLEPGEVLVLDDQAIHDVHAPKESWCAAIHVYLGDLGARDRSEWPSIDGAERPCDSDDMERRWMELARATDLVRPPAVGPPA